MKSWLKNTLQITTSFAEELIDGSLSDGVFRTVGKQIKQYFSSPDTIKSNYTTAIERSVSSIEIALKGTRAYYPTREKEFYKTHFGKFEQSVFTPFAQQAIQSGLVSSEDQLRNACIEECDEFKKILPSIVQMDDASNQDILSLVTSNATENPSQKMLEDISNSIHSKYLVPMLQKNNILYTGIIYHFNCILQSNPEFGTYLQNIQVTQLQNTIQQLQANTQRDAYNEARIDRLEQYIQAMTAYNDQMGVIGQKLDELYEKTLQTYEILERLEQQMKSNFQAMDDRLSAITNMLQRGFQSFASQPEQPMQPAKPEMRRETPVTRASVPEYAQPIYATTPQQPYKPERSAQPMQERKQASVVTKQSIQEIKQSPVFHAQPAQEIKQTPVFNAQPTNNAQPMQGIKQTSAINTQATQEKKQASVVTKQSMQEIKQSPVFHAQPEQSIKQTLDSNSQFMEDIKQSPIFNPQLAQEIRQSSACSQQSAQEDSFKVMNDLGKMYALFLENVESQYQASKENSNNAQTTTTSTTIPAFFQASQLNANTETNNNAEIKDNAMNNALFTAPRANNAQTKTASTTIPAFFQTSQLNANSEANNNAETKANAMPTISPVPNTTTLPDIFQNFMQPKK